MISESLFSNEKGQKATPMYTLPNLDFNSDLVDALFQIERLRASVGTGDAPAEIYRELHQLFYVVMSVVSARIEGNHTTVYEALEDATAEADAVSDRSQEITNITEMARQIDQQDPATPLTHTFIRNLHHGTVSNLVREGDPTPGSYRERDVGITGAEHRPPSWTTVHAHMTDLLAFANKDLPLKDQMLQVALAHHRFLWIHPFRNGNGRVARLFTYAMLRKTVFSTRGYSALNPTSVFGNDREAYIHALESADDLTPEGSIMWATYFAKGIRDDLDRLIKMQDIEFVENQLVGPAFLGLMNNGTINIDEFRVLGETLRKGVVKAGDLVSLEALTAPQRSRVIKTLVDKRLLARANDGPRFYRVSLAQGPIAPRLIKRLDDLGYLPKMLSNDQN